MTILKKVHEWAGSLGDNTSTGDGGNSLVLVIKGDLLRKFPDAIIYAQKAGIPTEDNGGLEFVSGEWKRVDNMPLPLVKNPTIDEKKHPIFSLTINPDITIVGFDLETSEAYNNLVINPLDGTNNLVIDPLDGTVISGGSGWYFVFAERPGKPRFGLDVLGAQTLSEPNSWSDLTWEHLKDASNNYP